MASGQNSPRSDTGGPESSLRGSDIQCSKNSLHRDSYDFKDFKLENLPEQYRTADIYDWIRINGDLTVRIRAFHVSSDRPNHFTDESQEYPLKDHRGGPAGRFGTAFIAHADFYNQDDNETYGDGQPSSPASRDGSVKGYVLIVTSTHTIYNEEETRGMKIDFFFNERNKSIELQVQETSDIPVRHFLGDWCEMKCDTDNCELLSKLIDLRNRLNEAEGKIGPDCGTSPLAIVVSHPHGRIKHVTMGHLLRMEETMTLFHLKFHTDGTFSFYPSSKITFDVGCKLFLPPDLELTLPGGNKMSLPKFAKIFRTLLSFSIRPLKELKFKQNQPFSVPSKSDFEFMSDARFSYTPDVEGLGMGNEGTSQTEPIPKGTVIHFHDEFALQPGRHCAHLSVVKRPLAIKEYFIAKRVCFDAEVCPGCSGAKVLFLTAGKTMGFAHSKSEENIGSTGSGCIYKLYSDGEIPEF